MLGKLLVVPVQIEQQHQACRSVFLQSRFGGRSWKHLCIHYSFEVIEKIAGMVR